MGTALANALSIIREETNQTIKPASSPPLPPTPTLPVAPPPAATPPLGAVNAAYATRLCLEVAVASTQAQRESYPGGPSAHHARFLRMSQLPSSGNLAELSERDLPLPTEGRLTRAEAFSYLQNWKFGRFQLVFSEPQHMVVPYALFDLPPGSGRAKELMNSFSTIGALVSAERIPLRLIRHLGLVPADIDDRDLRRLERLSGENATLADLPRFGGSTELVELLAQLSGQHVIQGIKQAWDSARSLNGTSHRYMLIGELPAELQRRYSDSKEMAPHVRGSFLHVRELESGTRTAARPNTTPVFPPARLNVDYFGTVHDAFRSTLHMAVGYGRECETIGDMTVTLRRVIQALDTWRRDTPVGDKSELARFTTESNAEIGTSLVLARNTNKVVVRDVAGAITTLLGPDADKQNPRAAIAKLGRGERYADKRLREIEDKRQYKDDDSAMLRDLVIEGDGSVLGVWHALARYAARVGNQQFGELTFARSISFGAVLPKEPTDEISYRDVRPYCTFVPKLEASLARYDSAVTAGEPPSATTALMESCFLATAMAAHIWYQDLLQTLASKNLPSSSEIATLLSTHAEAISSVRDVQLRPLYAEQPLAAQMQLVLGACEENVQRAREWLAVHGTESDSTESHQSLVRRFKDYCDDSFVDIEGLIRNLP